MAIQTAAKQLRYVPFIYCLLRVWGTAHFLFTEYPTKRHLRAFDWLLVIRVGNLVLPVRPVPIRRYHLHAFKWSLLFIRVGNQYFLFFKPLIGCPSSG